MTTARANAPILMIVCAIAILALGALVVLNWSSVSTAIGESSTATSVALFRAGELHSIGARLEEKYGDHPEMNYDIVSGVRRLSIRFETDPLSASENDIESHAREIATFALSATKKAKDVELVDLDFLDLGAKGSFHLSTTAQGVWAIKSDRPTSHADAIGAAKP